VRYDDLVKQLLEAIADVPPPPPAIIQKAEAPIRNVDIIAAALIGEAGGEGEKGMHAVMNVIVNRSRNNSDFVKAAVQTVLKPKQFSFFNKYNLGREDMKHIVNRAKQHANWNIAEKIALEGLSKRLPDLTDGATHYHVSSGKSKVTPKWTTKELGGKSSSAVITNTIGRHSFLKNVD